ncbi:MAG: PIF1 family ATP-dependent DNA helicase [Chitinophagaceae bacterium]|nr:PIF1 family ATP-dependent DNA helicase [Chitinophagaceae bacterium]
MSVPDTLTNPLQQLAFDYMMYTGESVFLTGKAGTGKTTFLRRLKEECPKQMAVLAPTGVAAINAGGVTIHSFFQLPFGPFVPVQGKAMAANEAMGEHALISRLRYGRDKRELLQSLDLLVIDEVSMVRADVLDAIDTILRHFRRRQVPFGGVQMLLIGDLYQLPPVVQNEEWQILGEYYEGPFFFHSHAIRRQPPVYVELQTIYRQSDERFIDLLNQVRNNRLTPAGLELLNSRCQPGFVVPDGEPWITLTTHNRKADAMNEQELNRLPGSSFSFKAEITGEFSDKSYPAEETLVLKEGAQASPIEVRPETWRNVQYSLNRQQQQVEEKELGSFTQYPLRLAWAVTIHKSQGLTFDRAVIDAAASFSAGQVYVALSRCRSLDGIVLPAPVPPSAVRVDERVQQYSGSAKAVDELRQFFGAAQRQYQQELLRHAFDGGPLQRASRYLQQQWLQHESSLGAAATGWATLQLTEADQLQATAAKFQAQLDRHFASADTMPEQDEFVQQRVRQAAQWFVPALQARLTELKQLPAVSDSKETAAELEEALAATLKAGRQWLQLLQACEAGFSSLGMIQRGWRMPVASASSTATWPAPTRSWKSSCAAGAMKK